MPSVVFIGLSNSTAQALGSTAYVYYGAPYISIPGSSSTNLLDTSYVYFGAPIISWATI